MLSPTAEGNPHGQGALYSATYLNDNGDNSGIARPALGNVVDRLIINSQDDKMLNSTCDVMTCDLTCATSRAMSSGRDVT